jgi:Protein of unknown function (DUF3617)
MKPRTRLVQRLFRPMPARLPVLLAAALAVGQAAADEWPALRAGLWEFDRTIETPGVAGKPQTMQTTNCTNPASDMKSQNEMLTKAGCKFSPVTRSGNTYSYSAVCKLQGVSGTSNSVLTVENDGAYTIRVESDLGGQPSRELLRAKRTGDCQP